MASRNWVLILAVLLSCLDLALAKARKGGLPNREELDSKYLLTNQIVDLTAKVDNLTTILETHVNILKRKDRKIKTLEEELQSYQNAKNTANADLAAKLVAATKENTDLNLQVSQLKDELESIKAENFAYWKRAERDEKTRKLIDIEKQKILENVNQIKIKLKNTFQSAGSWLHPWLATEAAMLHSLATSRWASHGAPLVERVQRLETVKAAQTHKFSKLYMQKHMLNFSRNVRPVVCSQWKKVKSTVLPEYHEVKKLTSQHVTSCKKYLSPYLSKMQETLEPYMQTVGKKGQPYVERAASFLSPHFDKANVIAGPYVKRVNDHYQFVVTQSSTLHEQLQDSVKETMSKHEMLSLWATKELIWYLSSALLALPVVAFLLVFSSVLGSTNVHGSKKLIRKHRSSSPSQYTSPYSNTRTRRQRQLTEFRRNEFVYM